LVLSTTRYLCWRTDGELSLGPDGLVIDAPETFRRQWLR